MEIPIQVTDDIPNLNQPPFSYELHQDRIYIIHYVIFSSSVIWHVSKFTDIKGEPKRR